VSGDVQPAGTGLPAERILVRRLRLWAHVGVLEFERQRGQWFELDLELALDLATADADDGLVGSLDYSRLIAALQRQARAIRCRTLEHYAGRILDQVEACAALRLGAANRVPVRLELRKCAAPVPGFNGTVAVRRSRHWPQTARR
jgi:dihydroneopterin aldolase